MSTDAGIVDELRRKLDAYQFPAEADPDHHRTKGGSTVDTNLLHQYKAARDAYLLRKVQLQLIDRATTTFDGSTGTFASVPVPSAEEQQALREQQTATIESIAQKAGDYQRRLLELQAKHEYFQTRNQEFEQLMEENAQGDDQDDSDDEGSFDGTDDVDTAELAAQNAKFVHLQNRLADLEVQLRTVQQQNDAVVQRIQKKTLELNGKENVVQGLMRNPAALEELKQENASIEAEVDKFNEIHYFYENLRVIMEELSGIRILGISAALKETTADTLMKVQLLNKYVLEIALATVHSSNSVDVVSAKFVSDNTLLIGPESDNAPKVQLQIPNVDDLVELSGKLQFERQADKVRFLLRETLARCTATHERVQELSQLQSTVVTNIGKYTSTKDQEVVCSLNHEQMTAVLRLTPDCPLVAGSVYVDQLVGLGGWDTALVERIKCAVNGDTKYKSPVAVIEAIQMEITHLVDEEGVKLPETPRMPVRGHVW
jgi:hypothetical protein